MADDRRRHWMGLAAATLALFAATFLAPLWIASPELDENRTLAPPPAPPRDLSALRAWPKAADAYVADRFPARPLLIGGLNAVRMRFGVSGSDRVVVGRHGWLFYDDGSHLGAARNDPPMTDARAQAWLSALVGRTEALQRGGIHYLVVSPPDKETVYPQDGPAWYDGPDPNRPAALLSRLAARSNAGDLLYLHDPIALWARRGLKTYSPHDTHWTGLGAYEGYAAIMGRLHGLGLADAPRPLDDFSDKRPSHFGEPRNLALMLGIASFVTVDYPEMDDPVMESRIRTTWLGTGHDWTQPRVIDTGQAGRPVLLMIMDSFSNALLPFLYGHFSRIVLAHNQDGAWREDLIDRFKPDIVLLEVVESGLPLVMSGGPPPSPAALRRIEAALAAPHRLSAAPHRPRPWLGPCRRTITGGPGNDRLDGGGCDDVIYGRAGDDTLNGGRGDDLLYGGKGDDRTFGGPGDDWISGDRGDDTLTGGSGADVFHSFAGAGLDLVTDFSAAQGDSVELDAGAAYVVRQEGPDTIIEMTGARMVLKGIKAASLPPGWLTVRQ